MPERSKPITDLDDPRYVKALAHPLRIRILALLGERDASPVQLAEHLDATLGSVAYHVRTLERLGLIEMVATHQRRGATEHVYSVREYPQITDRAWAETSAITKQAFVSSVLNQIGQFVTQSGAAGGFDRADAHATRNALNLDEAGWTELAQLSQRWLGEARAIEQRAADRAARSGEPTFDVGLVILLFEALPFFRSPPAGARQAGAEGTGARRRAGGERASAPR